MTKPKDYFEYWNKNRTISEKNKVSDRERIVLRTLPKIIKRGYKFLDIGCGYGKLMFLVKKRFPETFIQGIDYSDSEVKDALKSGLNVKKGNIEEGLDFKDHLFDIVYSGEVIEHLYNPDFFIRESNRVLKVGGYLIITTPNLCAWYNRILMIFGIQPLFLEPSTESKLIGAGFLKRFKKESQPVGHVRIFTYAALKDIFEKEGFKIIKSHGALYDQGLPEWALYLDKLFTPFTKLSSIFVIVAKKIRD